MRRFTGMVLGGAIMGLTGCAYVLNPAEDYLSADFNREIGTLATDASRRLTVVRMTDRLPTYGDTLRRGEFCSEPPPDAMIALAKSWTAALNSKNVQKDANLSHWLAYSMGPLLYRSQGLQWSRDTLSYLCAAYMNRAITKTEYYILIGNTMTAAETIILKEIDKLPKNPKIPETVTPPKIPLEGDEVPPEGEK